MGRGQAAKGAGWRRVNGGVGQAAGESRVKGRLLEARVEDPKSVETRKEIQVFAGWWPLLLPTARPNSQTFSPF